MTWIKVGATQESSPISTVRPRMLRNGLATECHLLPWIRILLCSATFGLLSVTVVLYLWHQRGTVWMQQAGVHWGVYAIGIAMILLGSAVLFLGVLTDNRALARRNGRHRGALAWFVLAAISGTAGLFGAMILLIYALRH